jgi:inner membrane protein
MPTVGHVAIGLAAARVTAAPDGVRPWTWAASLAALALLPDVDILAFQFGIRYGAPFGHRGAVHSLVFALVLGLLAWAAAAVWKLPAWRLSLVAVLVVASHGLLDTLTDGGRGIALLWPFSYQRYFAPWRPIPVAPVGARLFTQAGVRLMVYEAVLFLPVFLIAAWPRRAGADRVP